MYGNYCNIRAYPWPGLTSTGNQAFTGGAIAALVKERHAISTSTEKEVGIDLEQSVLDFYVQRIISHRLTRSRRKTDGKGI